MKKVIKKKLKDEVLTEEIPSVQKPINPITLDLGREDLNALRDKINEIISRM